MTVFETLTLLSVFALEPTSVCEPVTVAVTVSPSATGTFGSAGVTVKVPFVRAVPSYCLVWLAAVTVILIFSVSTSSVGSGLSLLPSSTFAVFSILPAFTSSSVTTCSTLITSFSPAASSVGIGSGETIVIPSASVTVTVFVSL